ncbi:MAG: hypothetical protein ACK5R2_17100, partial [Cyanobacteriota bacterium]
ATDFPLHPPPEDLPDTYQECRAALVSANRSRGVLKAQSDRRGVVIAEVALIDESERQSGYWLVQMFQRLLEQAKRWRVLKANAAALADEVSPVPPSPITNEELP